MSRASADLRSNIIRPVRLQAKRTLGFRLQDVSRAVNGLPAIKCTRPGILGNPFVIGGRSMKHPITGRIVVVANAEIAVFLYRRWLDIELTRNDKLVAAVERARGHNLACTCSLDAPCHVDVLLWRANV